MWLKYFAVKLYGIIKNYVSMCFKSASPIWLV